MARPVASVIVRTKDKADTVETTFRALRRQSLPVEIVVVDSGSTDGTLDVAARYADQVLHLPAAEFTYGRALNLGAAAATCEVHMALSAHCAPVYDDWVERSVAYYARPDVAGTNQSAATPSGEPILSVYHQRLEDARHRPHWGFSNHGSSWRASVWRELPFREDLGACEDKEWSWRVLSRGWTIAYDPLLLVPAPHRRGAGLPALWRRVRKESQALAELGALPRPTYRGLRTQWWSDFSPHSPYPQALRRLSPYRSVELHAAFVGARTRHRLSGPSHDDLTRGWAR